MASNYGGVPMIDFSPIAELGNDFNKARLRSNRERTLAELAQGAPIGDVANKLFSVGDVEGGLSLARLADAQAMREYNIKRDERDFGFRQQEAQQGQQRWQAGHQLQQRQLDATLEGGRVPPGFRKAETGGLEPVPGGPQDPAYLGGRKLAEDRAAKAALSSGADPVLRMVDQLEAKTKDPKFSASTGPFVGGAAGQPVWSPGRIAYEGLQKPENKAFLDQIKQDAQAINTVMQRELLKGGGQITENEREQINQILGAITTARSAGDAKMQLDNFRSIVRNMFNVQTGGMPAQGTPPGTTPAVAPSTRVRSTFDAAFGRPEARAAQPQNDIPEISQAREAIARGADPAKVRELLMRKRIKFDDRDLELN